MIEMRIVFFVLLMFLLFGCARKYPAFYLSRTAAYDMSRIGSSFCEAVILEKNNTFFICSFRRFENSKNIENVTWIARGSFVIKNDTLELNPKFGRLNESKYLINRDQGKYVSLAIIPSELVDENGESLGFVRGRDRRMYVIDRKLVRRIKKEIG